MMKNQSKRQAIIITTFICSIALIIYGYINNPSISLSMCLDNPQQYDGQIIEIGTEITVARVWQNDFTLRQMDKEIPVYGDNSNLNINDFIYLRAIFHKEGFLELLQIRAAKLRRIIIWISVPPVLLVLVLFFRQYRFNIRSVQFEERNTCLT